MRSAPHLLASRLLRGLFPPPCFPKDIHGCGIGLPLESVSCVLLSDVIKGLNPLHSIQGRSVATSGVVALRLLFSTSHHGTFQKSISQKATKDVLGVCLQVGVSMRSLRFCRLSSQLLGSQAALRSKLPYPHLIFPITLGS